MAAQTSDLVLGIHFGQVGLDSLELGRIPARYSPSEMVFGVVRGQVLKEGTHISMLELLRIQESTLQCTLM